MSRLLVQRAIILGLSLGLAIVAEARAQEPPTKFAVELEAKPTRFHNEECWGGGPRSETARTDLRSTCRRFAMLFCEQVRWARAG